MWLPHDANNHHLLVELEIPWNKNAAVNMMLKLNLFNLSKIYNSISSKLFFIQYYNKIKPE
jgi:hypothetical protein